jgi:hypothetical protein
MSQQHSRLTEIYEGTKVPLKVHQSGAGFYLGAVDPETGEPIARDSVEYWPTQEAAQHALDTGEWTQRTHA